MLDIWKILYKLFLLDTICLKMASATLDLQKMCNL